MSRNADTWDSFPSYAVPVVQNAAHPVTTEVPPSYSGTTSWLKFSDAVEEFTKVEAKRRGLASTARLSGRAKLFKERLDRERLKDAESGVEHLLATLRLYFVKHGPSVFLCRFFQMLCYNQGQIDFQRWMVTNEIAYWVCQPFQAGS